MWGEWVDQTYDHNDDSPDVKWLHGEELLGGAGRSLKEPGAYKVFLENEIQMWAPPDRMGSPWWYTGESDNGGVHINSGVGNKLAYLLTDGDTFNDHNVMPMGITETSELFYEVQTNLLTCNADYYGLYYALIQAAINLEWTPADKENLEEACQAVEIATAPFVIDTYPADGVTISTVTGNSMDIDVTFSKPVLGVDVNDMVLSGTAANGADVGTPTDVNNTWCFPVTGYTDGKLNITLAPNPNDIVDSLGNNLEPRPTTWSYNVITCPVSDPTGDCCVYEEDLGIFNSQWLQSVDTKTFTLSSGELGDRFGYSVAISGDYAIVGATFDTTSISNSGAAYIFRYDGENWTQQQKLIAFDASEDDYFGYSVAISGDYAIIGAYGDESNSGSAYIFKYNGTFWSQQQKLTASDGAANNYFGWSVDVNDGFAVIGAYGAGANGPLSGAAYIFKRNGTTWNQQQKLLPSDGAVADFFGWSVAISGNYAIIGAHYDDDNGADSGSAYIFKYDGTSWSQQQKLTPSDGATGDNFGYSVSIEDNYAIMGARRDGDKGPLSGSAYIFKYDGTNWIKQQKLTASDGAAYIYFGCSVSITTDYAVIGNGAGSNSGAAYTFKYNGRDWTENEKLTPSGENSFFGYSVSADKYHTIIGAYGDAGIFGSAHVFGLCPIADFTGDCVVNIADYSILALEWMLCGP
jgi:hypothetical protein